MSPRRAWGWPEWIVAGTWLVCVLATAGFIARYGAPFPLVDDLTLVPQYVGEQPVTIGWLWTAYSVHRNFLAWLILTELHKLANGDHRVAMFVQFAIVALTVATLLWALRKLRGRSSIVDASLPLAWLHWGHYENELMAFQLTLYLALVLTVLWSVSLVVRTSGWNLRGGIWLALAVAALPLCAAFGLLAALVLAPTSLVLGIVSWRKAPRGQRTSAIALVAGALVSLALVALYLRGLQSQPSQTATTARLLTSTRLAAGAIGPYCWPDWGIGASATAVLLIATLGLLLRAWRRSNDEAPRVFALGASIVSVGAWIAAVGWGRATSTGHAGEVSRYLALLLPLQTSAMFAWELYGSAFTKRAVQGLFLVASCAAAIAGVRMGTTQGEHRLDLFRGFVADVEHGWNSSELAMRHREWLMVEPLSLSYFLATLRAHHVPPFTDRSADPTIDQDLLEPIENFSVQPVRATPRKRIRVEKLDGEPMVELGEPGELVLPIAEGATRAEGRFGLAPAATRAGRSDGILFEVELRSSDAAPRTLFSAELTPHEDRRELVESAFAIELPEHASGELALVTRNAPGRDERWDRGWWSGVVIH